MQASTRELPGRQERRAAGAPAKFRHSLGLHLRLPLAPPPSLLAAPAMEEGTGALGEVGRRGEGAGFGAALNPRLHRLPRLPDRRERELQMDKLWNSSVGLWSGDFNSETTVWLVRK